MNSDELKNVSNFITYYRDINDDILRSLAGEIRDIRRTIPNSTSCYCVMGHTDIRMYKACLHCNNFYHLSSFKEPCEDFLFTGESGEIEGKDMIIKHYPNTIIVPRQLSTNINNKYTTVKAKGILVANSDYFTNSLIASLVIDSGVIASFVCMNNGFQMSRYGDVELENLSSKSITRLIIHLAGRLNELKRFQFSHGDPIVDNLTILLDDNKYSIKLDNLDYAAVTYNNKRYYKGSANKVEVDGTISKYSDYFTTNDNYTELDRAIKFSGVPIYPCVLDFYCFVVSMLCNRTIYNKLISDDLFMDNVFKHMFYDYDYEKVKLNLVRDYKVKLVDCLRILRDIKMKYDVLKLVA